MNKSVISLIGGILGALIGFAIAYHWVFPTLAPPPYTRLGPEHNPPTNTVGEMAAGCKWASTSSQIPDSRTDMRTQLYGFICIGAVQASSELLMQNALDCEPDNISTQQNIKTVSDYITAHPDEANLPFVDTVAEALKQKWPCK